MAIRVDATGDTLNRTSSLPSNTAFTICGWARAISDNAGTFQHLVLALDAGGTDGYALVWDFGSNDMRVITLDGGAPYDSAALSPRPATGIDFFWYIKCGGTGVNGVSAGWRAAGSPTYQTAQATMAATIAQATSMYFGGAIGAYYFDHSVWNVKVWDRELSTAELEIESYYERVMFPANVHAHWRMRNTSDVVDRSGNGRNLTTGGTLTTETDWGLWRPGAYGIFLSPQAGGAIDLIVADATHTHAADAAVLSQASTLVAADALHAHAADNLVVTLSYTLAVAEVLHAHATDNTDLTQGNVLAVGDALHTHTAESLVLVQAHVLAVAEALHNHAADSPALTQANTLAADEAIHAHSAESPTVSTATTLSTADATHGHIADSPALVQAHILAVADALHAHGVDNVDLSFAAYLTISDATHGHTVESPALIQASALTVAEAAHGHTADSLILSPGYVLAIDDSTHLHAAESVVLTQAHILAIQEALHTHLADGVALTQAGALTVADALHAHLVDAVVLNIPGLAPQSLIIVTARSRTIRPKGRSRTITIH